MDTLKKTVSLRSWGIELLFFPAGGFVMGHSGLSAGTQPLHLVRLDAFWLARFPLSQEIWSALMPKNPSRFGGKKKPVESISWHQAQQFIKKLNEFTGGKFRLPTEAEWEFAARGGLTRTEIQGEYNGNIPAEKEMWCRNNAYGTTHDVGLREPNSAGLYDMFGNVREMCFDWYDLDYYQESPLSNPKGPEEPPDEPYKVTRGGCFNSMPGSCSAFSRSKIHPADSIPNVGFRLASD